MHISKKKKLILANSILIVLLIAGTVYAWFAVNYNNEVYDNDVTVVADNMLELSVDGGNTWHNYISLKDNTDWFQDVKFTDVTGSGNGTFYRPDLIQEVGYADVDPSGSLHRASRNSDYARFTLMMRSKDRLNVYLGAGSNVVPSVGMAHLKSTTSSVPNESTYSTSGNHFSRDIVTGAIRVSMIDTSTSSDLHKFTWIPRPEIYFGTTNQTDYTRITTTASSGESYTHKYLTYPNKAVTPFTGTLYTGDMTSDLIIATLNKSNPTDNYYSSQVDFCVWLEGVDAEARRAFVDGKFNMNLKIVSEDYV